MFWCCFAYVFASLLVFSFPKLSLKNSLDVRSCVFGLSSFFLWLFRRRRRFFFEREDSSGSHRAHPHTHLVFLFLLLVFVPRRFCLFTRFGRASFPSGVLSGCHSGPRAFFGFSRDFSQAFFLDARRQGCFFASRACVVFPLLVLFAAFFTRTRRGGPVIVRGVPPCKPSRLPFARVRAKGEASSSAVWTRPFGIHFSLLCVWQRVTGTPRAFFSGEGALSLPPQALFHTHLSFASRPRFFFFSLSLFAGPCGPELDSLTRYPSPIGDGVFSVFCPLMGEIQLLCGMRGKCCPFFEKRVSVIPSVCFALFHRISVSNSGLYVGGSYPVFLCAS